MEVNALTVAGSGERRIGHGHGHARTRRRSRPGGSGCDDGQEERGRGRGPSDVVSSAQGSGAGAQNEAMIMTRQVEPSGEAGLCPPRTRRRSWPGGASRREERGRAGHAALGSGRVLPAARVAVPPSRRRHAAENSPRVDDENVCRRSSPRDLERELPRAGRPRTSCHTLGRGDQATGLWPWPPLRRCGQSPVRGTTADSRSPPHGGRVTQAQGSLIHRQRRDDGVARELVGARRVLRAEVASSALRLAVFAAGRIGPS